MSDTPTLLRDLIDIPERVQTNDFVLKLSDGVTEAGAAATIATYVVTPQLAKAFDHALGFIQGAVEGRHSAASYLHGSFGSGSRPCHFGTRRHRQSPRPLAVWQEVPDDVVSHAVGA